MGEQTTPGMLYMKANDGSWTKLCDVVDYPPGTEGPDTCDVHTLVSDKVFITFKTPKNLRCGSRKRYIKLLMSRGIDRNTANDVAEFYQRYYEGFSYQWLWSLEFWLLAQKGVVTDVH